MHPVSVGGSLSRKLNGESLEHRRAKSSYQCTSIEGSTSSYQSYLKKDICKLPRKQLLLQMDNTTAVSYMNKRDGGRCRIMLNEFQDRVDFCQTSVCKNTNTSLHPRSRPFCIQTEPPSPIVCCTSPRSRGNSNWCVHFGLESVDIAHTPTAGSF